MILKIIYAERFGSSMKTSHYAKIHSILGVGKEVFVDFESGETRYPCVTRTDEGYAIGIDIFKETGHLLSGHLDSIRPSLDSNIKKALASKPTVDILQNLLFNAILAGCHKQKIPLVQKSYWPCGKSFAVCLTHDIDEIKKHISGSVTP